MTFERLLACLRADIEHQTARAEVDLAHRSFESSEQKKDTIANIEEELQILGDVDDPRCDELVETACRRMAKELGTTIDNLPIDSLALDQLIRRAMAEVRRCELSIVPGRYRHEYFDRAFDPTRPPHVSFGTLVMQFLTIENQDARAKGINDKGIDQRESYVRTIVQIVDPQTDVAMIDYDTCLKVRSTLARLPFNRTKIFGKLPLD